MANRVVESASEIQFIPSQGDVSCQFKQVFALDMPAHFQAQFSASSTAEPVVAKVIEIDNRPRQWYHDYQILVTELGQLFLIWQFALMEKKALNTQLHFLTSQYEKNVRKAQTLLDRDAKQKHSDLWLSELRKRLGDAVYDALAQKLTPAELLQIAEQSLQTLPLNPQTQLHTVEQQLLQITATISHYEQRLIRLQERESEFTQALHLQNHVIVTAWQQIINAVREFMQRVDRGLTVPIDANNFSVIKHKAIVETLIYEARQRFTTASVQMIETIFSKGYGCIIYRIGSVESIIDAHQHKEDLSDKIVEPDVDIKATLVASWQRANYRVTEFYATPDGWMTARGERLSNLLTQTSPLRQVYFLPKLGPDFQPLPEQYLAIVDPSSSSKRSLPTIKFVETYSLQTVFTGVSLGEVVHGINLAAGEERQTTLTMQTTLARKMTSATSMSSNQQQQTSTSFQESLQQEFTSATTSSQQKQQQRELALTQEEKIKVNQQSQAEQADQSQSDTSVSRLLAEEKEEQENSEKTKVTSKSKSSGVNLGVASKKKKKSETTSVSERMASLEKQAFSSEQKNSQQNKTTLTQKSVSERSRDAALSAAFSQKSTRQTAQTQSITSKAIQNSVSQVAATASSQNQISATSSESSEFSETQGQAQEVKLKNPNMGATLNYYYRQLRNVFATNVSLSDVHIVVCEDTGVRLSASESLYEVRVFDISQFNDLFRISEQVDYTLWLTILIINYVVDNYLKLTDKGILPESFLQANNIDSSKIATVTKLREKTINQTSTNELRKMVDSLRHIQFFSKSTVISKPIINEVNAPALFVDAQLGVNSALEPYNQALQTVDLLQRQAAASHDNAKKAYYDAQIQFLLKYESRIQESKFS